MQLPRRGGGVLKFKKDVSQMSNIIHLFNPPSSSTELINSVLKSTHQMFSIQHCFIALEISFSLYEDLLQDHYVQIWQHPDNHPMWQNYYRLYDACEEMFSELQMVEHKCYLAWATALKSQECQQHFFGYSINIPEDFALVFKNTITNIFYPDNDDIIEPTFELFTAELLTQIVKQP